MSKNVERQDSLNPKKKFFTDELLKAIKDGADAMTPEEKKRLKELMKMSRKK